jgi:ABC-type transporter Mla maintaining outer membrane lipid asymmetry ATPase subunit MlaF
MLKNGKILAMERSEEFQRLSDPLVREFISVP